MTISEQPVSENKDIESGDKSSATKVRRILSLLVILLTLAAQIYFSTQTIREDVGMPPSCKSCSFDETSAAINATIITLFSGVFLFILIQIVFENQKKPSKFLQKLAGALPFSGASPWVVTALAFSLLAVMAMLLFEKAKLTNYIPVLVIWFFAAICYFIGFAKGHISFSQWREWFKLHRYELLAVALVTLLAIVLRFYKLGDLPRVVNGDEGRAGVAALSTNVYPYVNPFALWENFGALYLQFINFCLSIFGSSPFSLRLAAAIGGSIAIPAVYLLTRQISGHRVAMIAAIFLAISHTHIHFSRTVAVAYIQGTWLIPFEFYFLLSGITKRSSWRTALGGMLLAVHYNVYLDAQIITALIFVYLIIALIFLRSWIKPALQQVAVFWGGFAIMILPEFVFAWEHPADFFQRINKDGMFQTGWLSQEMVNTGANAAQIIIQRIVHTFLSLIYYPSFDFYGTSVPVLNMISAVLFLLGLALVFWKTRSPGFLLLNGHFWSGILAIAIFSLPASADTYRVLIVLPTALIMAAVGLDYILTTLGLGWANARKTYVAIATIIVASIMIFNTWTYYSDFLGQCKYGSDDGPTRFASYMGNFARDADPDAQLYLLSDAVYINGTHQSVAFLSHNRGITNLADPIETVNFKPGSILIASPNRIPELQAWAEAHPAGKVHSEHDCGNLMLFTYQFP